MRVITYWRTGHLMMTLFRSSDDDRHKKNDNIWTLVQSYCQKAREGPMAMRKGGCACNQRFLANRTSSRELLSGGCKEGERGGCMVL